MPADNNFWRDRYQDSWEEASKKENLVAKIIENITGKKVIVTGLGAGTTEFLEGNAQEHGHEKGDPDLHLESTNIYFEVTGPNSTRVSPRSDLWIRPDKLNNAVDNLGKHETWLVHVLPDKGGTSVIRVILLDETFFSEYHSGTFPVEEVTIRGTKETYVKVPVSHPLVRDFLCLRERLKKL